MRSMRLSSLQNRRISRAESKTRYSNAECDHEHEVRDQRFFHLAFRTLDRGRAPRSCIAFHSPLSNSSGVPWIVPEVARVYFSGNALDSL